MKKGAKHSARMRDHCDDYHAVDDHHHHHDRFGLVSSRVVAVCCHAKNCHVFFFFLPNSFCVSPFCARSSLNDLLCWGLTSLRLAALSLFHSFRLAFPTLSLPLPPFACNSRGSPGSMASHCASSSFSSSDCVFAEFIQLCSHTQTGERERERGGGGEGEG